MNIVLELTHDDQCVLCRPLEQAPLVVGSNPECDLCVPNPDVDPVQCVLQRAGDRVILENRASEGTKVNNRMVKNKKRLSNDDVIGLGALIALVRFSDTQDTHEGRTKTLARNQPTTDKECFVVAPEIFPNTHFELSREGVTIGSDPSNTIVLNDPFVSRFHARFWFDHGRVMLSDVKSRNGVFVSGLRILEGEVPIDVHVTIGKTILIVRTQEAVRNPAFDIPATNSPMIGDSPPMDAVRELLRRAAPSTAPVLLAGETGTGKEVAARLLNALSPRANKPFVTINCGSLSRHLVESELFGHERGAFTGAIQSKEGAFAAADQGTLFLDEIGELPLELQPQLLRVLEQGEVRRVGAHTTQHVDVRIVAATNRDLATAAEDGTFREDLFHRLNVIPVRLPSLEERSDDIPALANHFLKLFAPPGVTLALDEKALTRLATRKWSGNIRELKNTIQRSVLLRKTNCLGSNDLLFSPSTLFTRVQTQSATSSKTLADIERQAIVTELRRHQGSRTHAAEALGVSRSTLYRKMEEHELNTTA